MLEKIFNLKANNTSIKKEFLAGITTFITMSYIIFVNPQMMAQSGMDYGASFVGTCIAASLACFFMGIYANWPVGLAPGMGLNAFFTYTVVGGMGYSWEIALGAVFWSGILFVIMSITPLRKWMLEGIPLNLRIAMGSGVGLFIGLIGLKNGGIISGNESTLLSLGDLNQFSVLLSILGFLIISILSIRKISGSIIIGIFTITSIAVVTGLEEFTGIVSFPPDPLPVFMKLDVIGAFDVAMISVIISFLFVNFFDTTGTLMGMANRARLVKNSGEIQNLDKAIKADSTSSVFGSFFGCAPVTSYVESSAGIEIGGRTGLTAVFTGSAFLVSIFLSPLSEMVPPYATAGVLIYVAILMLSDVERLNWSDSSEIIPSLIIIIMIPLTFSIANGIALGFITYTIIKLASNKHKEISSSAWFLTLIFLAKFIFL
ncbi:MAG: guanine permease [Candidatus Marinimicrobia bacterium]|nr:guanine permease [Candidatus Neomarinimicrobiota bacterium]|tara:strand:+ start:4662 stop:5951 length:1290 start_codon:yes stop_codon:yes gene_type:complete